MTIRVSKSQFKAKALELMRQVERSGQPLVITDHGKPSLEIRRLATDRRDPFERLGGAVVRYDHPFEPIGAEDWEALR